MEELSQTSWPSIAMADTTTDIVSFPALIAALSVERKAPTEEQERAAALEVERAAADAKLKLMCVEDHNAVSSLMEMFPGRPLSEVFSAFISCDKDIGVASNLLLQEPEAHMAVGSKASNESVQCSKSDTANTVPIPLASSEFLASRYEFIKQLNDDFKACCEVINFNQVEKFFSVASLLAKNRTFLLYIVKSDLFNTALSKSVGSGDIGEVVIQRAKALKFTARGDCDTEGLWSIFGQAFRSLHGKPVAAFRRSDQLFKVLFAGERGHDAGGLYRECWSMMSQELMSSTLPLLLPCANSKYVFNSDGFY